MERGNIIFKMPKIESVNNEKITISLKTIRKITESFKTLAFDISGENHSFSFTLNCKLEKSLGLPMNEEIDFKNYVFETETWLNVRGNKGIVPEMNSKIIRYLKNKFIISLIFYTDSIDEDDYAGIIEFDFNLDDYLKCLSK